MKKIFYSMFALIMALSFASCEDVPAPYDDPANGGNGEPTEEGIYLKEAFTVNKGSFEIKTVKGRDWRIDHNVMTASGYNFDTRETEETETYLVSPAFNLTKSEGAFISFKYIHMYVTPEATNNVLITDKYTGDPATTEWKDMSINWKESEIKDFDTYFDYSMNIPAEFIGKENIVMAFAFKCSAVKSCTFKVKDLLVKEGKAEENGDDDDVKEGEYLNESFSKDFGKFKVANVKGEPWIIDQYGYAKGTGHQGKDLPSVPSDSYLVSSEMDMTQSKGASITFDYVLRFVNSEVKNQVLATDNYTGDPTTTQWTDITGKLTEVNDWKDWQKFSANIPEQFAGKNKVVVALHYTCGEKSATWEVKNVVVKEGKGEDNPGGGDQPSGDVLKPVNGKFIGESFNSSFGVFSVSHISGTPWIIDFHTAKASGYDNQTKETTASNSYLVSKPMDMSSTKEASLNFEYLLKYVTFNGTPVAGVKNEVLVTDNFTGDPKTTQWTVLNGELKEYKDKDWNTFFKYDIDIPSQFMGKGKVVVALHYECAEKSGTWEVKNLNVVEGKAGQGGGDNPGGGDTPDVGDPTTSNGDFETWIDGMPNNWEGPASKANLFQSTDAHSGKYSVQVGGSDQNMRLGYKTLNLKKGHYVMKFFVKAVTGEGGAARPGYVILTNGKPDGGNAYKYGDYINDLKKDSWKEGKYEFDIPSDGEYTVVVMNAKNPGKDILVDDFTLEYNGEFIIK